MQRLSEYISMALAVIYAEISLVRMVLWQAILRKILPKRSSSSDNNDILDKI